ncbi:hypothetical protein O5470_24375, partial [Escherichia coli]|nr:hypothetical protein [Escherichia coli]
QKITNPFLLSRIYDVVWCNNRKNKDVAIKAIDSYAEMLNIAIEKLIIKNDLSKRLEPSTGLSILK